VVVAHNECMHALVFVIGDNVHEQMQALMFKHFDFYMIGGRWTGILPKRKPDGTIKNVDSLRVGELAWQEALTELEQQARAAFAEWRQLYELHGRPKTRREIARELGVETSRYGQFPEEVYAIYREQGAMRGFDEAHPDNIHCPINLYGFDEEEYVQEVLEARLSPHSLVVAGKWIEGPTGLDKREPEWSANVRDRLLSLPPDTRLTAVDVHF
jgi:hypothetical protein